MPYNKKKFDEEAANGKKMKKHNKKRNIKFIKKYFKNNSNILIHHYSLRFCTYNCCTMQLFLNDTLS
ncbi:hypothetical protein T07_8906 [Trichinella nelsoni]|uniref:Uncharacterized protein n=1 Tax=Trichinella nelsoni TaxID=6336 RepID=A0A0V0SNC0_9BILA|nr:hypothetical protein T07_8906 [Trichinella nelsoni]